MSEIPVVVVHAFPNAETMTLRLLTPYDVPQTLRIFREAVREGAAGVYSETERNAWAPSVMEAGSWRIRRLSQPTWVAEVRGEVVGFSDLTSDGEVGMLYVPPDHTRFGIGSALLDEVERHAREEGRSRLHTHASLLAEPVFARRGFVVVRRQWAERGGERLAQAVMVKVLGPEVV